MRTMWSWRACLVYVDHKKPVRHLFSNIVSVRKYRNYHALSSGCLSFCIEAETKDANKSSRRRSPASRKSRIIIFPFSIQVYNVLQVSEKCPECGHPEAFSKEMQVKIIVTYIELVADPFCSSWEVRTKARPFCIQCVFNRQRTVTIISYPRPVRFLQARLARQQLAESSDCFVLIWCFVCCSPRTSEYTVLTKAETWH